MKTYSKKIIKTNMSKVDSFKVMNSNRGMGARECIGKTFKLKGFLIYTNTCHEIDDVTGDKLNDTERTNLVLLTDDDLIIGTNSQVMIRSLNTLLDVFDNEELRDINFTITQGVSRRGYRYNDLEIA